MVDGVISARRNAGRRRRKGKSSSSAVETSHGRRPVSCREGFDEVQSSTANEEGNARQLGKSRRRNIGVNFNTVAPVEVFGKKA